MQNDPYSDILSLVSTRTDLNKINNELDLLEAGIFEMKGNTFDFVLKNSISEGLANVIAKLVSGQNKEEIIKKIKERLAQIKFVEITIAIDPSQEFIEKMVSMIKENINQNVALDIKIDRSILGGARVIFEGKYHDGSLKNKLDKILVNYA